MTKALTMLLNQDVSGKKAGKTIEAIVKTMARAKGINPIEINAIDTLPIEPATFENHLSICIFNTSIYLCLGS
jgi:hypothetical protein